MVEGVLLGCECKHLVAIQTAVSQLIAFSGCQVCSEKLSGLRRREVSTGSCFLLDSRVQSAWCVGVLEEQLGLGR